MLIFRIFTCNLDGVHQRHDGNFSLFVVDGQSFLAHAQEDADGVPEDVVEGEGDDDATVETDEAAPGADGQATDAATTEDKVSYEKCWPYHVKSFPYFVY